MTTPTPRQKVDALDAKLCSQEESDGYYEMRELAYALALDLAAAQEALAELHRGKVLADGMANTIRGFILQRAERETLDEVAAAYRRWEEDYCHRNFRKPKP